MFVTDSDQRDFRAQFYAIIILFVTHTSNLENHIYYTISSATVADFTVKGSKFISYSFPVSSIEFIKLHLDEVKKLHPKAVHHCYAYRLSKQQFRANDDGEPSGTAGRPILGQIDSKRLTNTLVVVVRYFGGVLLGTSGLVSAYKKAAHDCLAAAKVISCDYVDSYQVDFAFEGLEQVMSFMKKRNIQIIEKQLELNCSIKISMPIKHLEELENELSTISTISKI